MKNSDYNQERQHELSSENDPTRILLPLVRFFLLLSIWYAVLVDVPVVLERSLPHMKPLRDFIGDRELLNRWVYTDFLGFIHRINNAYQIPWFKLGKDLFLIIAVFFSLVLLWRNRSLQILCRSYIVKVYLFLIGVVISLAIVSLLRNGVWTALIGLRVHLPLGAFLVGLNFDREGLGRVWKGLVPLFFIQVFFVIIQLLAAPKWRTTGTIIDPNAFGLFLGVFLLLLAYLQPGKWRTLLYGSITLLLILTTQSRSSILLALVLLGLFLWVRLRNNRQRIIALIALFFLMPFIPTLLEWLSGRPNALADYLRFRGLAPWRYLSSATPLDALIGEGLGRGTTLMRRMMPLTGISPDWGYLDSLMGSLLVQGGLLLFSLTLSFFLSPLLLSPVSFFTLALPFFTMGSAALIQFWEAWPPNFLVMVLYGHLVRERSEL